MQIEQADPTIPVSVCWDELDEETRASAVEGVVNARNGASPEESHENWVEFKQLYGWSYGPVKDEGKKTHPLLVHYSALPESQKVKDELFTSIVRALS